MACGGLSAASIKQIIKCPVCLDRYDKPKVLPCQHTVCVYCLKGILLSNMTNDSFPCPECKCSVKIVRNNMNATIEQFPDSLILKKLIDELPKASSEDKTQNPCVDTVCFLNRIGQCPLHQNEIVEYYCKDHDITGCIRCGFEKHKQCDDVIPIVDIIKDNTLNQQIQETMECLERLELNAEQLYVHETKKVHDAEEVCEQIENNLSLVEKEIKDALYGLRSKVTKTCSDNMAKIKQKYNVQTDQVYNLKTGVSKLKEKLKHGSQNGDDVVSFLVKREISDSIRGYEIRLQELNRNKTDDCIRFSTQLRDRDVIERISNLITVDSERRSFSDRLLPKRQRIVRPQKPIF